MRCLSCDAENPADAAACGDCGKSPRRRPRRRAVAEESDTPFSSRLTARDRLAIAAYRYAVFGLIPFAGLVLGPLALVLGLVARQRVKKDPSLKGGSPATAAVVLGALIGVANWVGLILMVVGLKSV